MKHRYLLGLALAAAGAAALYCIVKNSIEQDEEDAFEEQEDDRGPFISGLANPVRKLDLEELRNLSGLDIRLEATEIMKPRAYCINTDPLLFGVKLEDSDGLEYDFRFTDKRSEGNISGMYYEWTTEEGYPSEAPECSIFLNELGQGVCSWEDEHRRYTISMTEGASAVKLVWMRNRLLSLIF